MSKWNVSIPNIIWSLALGAVAMWGLIMSIGLEFALPPIQAEAIAEQVAPALEVSESELRKELTRALSQGVARKALVRAVPFLVLLALLMVRFAYEALKVRVKEGETVEGRRSCREATEDARE